jgi:hypothetical protein
MRSSSLVKGIFVHLAFTVASVDSKTLPYGHLSPERSRLVSELGFSQLAQRSVTDMTFTWSLRKTRRMSRVDKRPA